LLEPVGSDAAFLVMGDWGTGSEAQRAIAVQMGNTAKETQARFIISTGDNFYRRGVASVDDPQWTEKFEDIYDSPALMVPWYITLGNHDHEGDITAQVSYGARSSRWRLPARYYKHSESLADGSKADFFHLDTTSLKANCEKEQLTWLERELAASNSVWKIVVGHHPIHSGGSHADTRELVVLVKPLLERYGVQVYLNGHDHHLEHVAVGKVHYFTSGAAAKPRKASAFEGSRFVMGEKLGYMSARLSSSTMRVEFIDEFGAVLYRTSIGAQAAPVETNRVWPYSQKKTKTSCLASI
jgi:acid phosphatase